MGRQFEKLFIREMAKTMPWIGHDCFSGFSRYFSGLPFANPAGAGNEKTI
jgi:hypothetical protein